MTPLSRYAPIVGRDVLVRLRQKAKQLHGKHMVMVSSTHQGGGVAEILNTLVPLLNELGVDCGWRIIHGNPDFFSVTKKLHNMLQGGRASLSADEKRQYIGTNERFSTFTHFDHHDLVVVHDPQPAALIAYEPRVFGGRRQPWVWRCHIDLFAPQPRAWKFLHPFVRQYDRVVVSHAAFGAALRHVPDIIHPAIDPLSSKNRPLSRRTAFHLLHAAGIDPRIPFIAQVSRYDKWKDPEGVVRVFDRVKKKTPCHLVLLGNTASDDPEGAELYRTLQQKHGRRRDIHLLVNMPDNDRFVNAVQSQAVVVLQKSIREGFALTVAEALYKGTPVVASRVGGIPLQVRHGENGFLHAPEDEHGIAESVAAIVADERLRARLGRAATAGVREQFLVTRLVEDWLDVFMEHLSVSVTAME